MNGIVSTSGQYWLLNTLASKINTDGGLYVGLMSNAMTPSKSFQTPSGIVELDGDSTICSGYERQLSSTWTVVSGSMPYIKGSDVTFTVGSGVWSDVYGYFITLDTTYSGVLWSELFPPDKGGLVASGNPIILSPIYYQY